MTDRRPCALSSRLLRNLSRSSTSRNRKKTSLHSGWVSNNLWWRQHTQPYVSLWETLMNESTHQNKPTPGFPTKDDIQNIVEFRVDSHTECIHSAECECAAHHHCDELGFSPPHTLNRDLIVPFWSYSVYSYHHCPLLWFLHLTAAISNKPGWICGIFLATRSSDELPYQEPGRNLSRMEPQPLLEFSFFSDLTSTSFLK